MKSLTKHGKSFKINFNVGGYIKLRFLSSWLLCFFRKMCIQLVQNLFASKNLTPLV